MKKLIAFLCFISIMGLNSFGQKVAEPSSKDWRKMMLDPNVSFFETQKAFYNYWEGKTPGKGSGYNVFKRWEAHWQSRVDQSGHFPKASVIQQEFDQFQKDYPNQLKTSEPVWRELGPKNRNNWLEYYGLGRIGAIAFHPTDTATIFVGAASGGFWITHDSGNTWTTHTDNLVSLSISAIAVHPENPDRILIGTGDADDRLFMGVGTMISEDGGQTFSVSNEGMGDLIVGSIAQHETDPNILLAGTDGGIFKTTDFGQNWIRVTDDTDNYRDIKYQPGNMNVAYASSNNGFFRSTDGGDTWEQITNGITAEGRIVIGVSPADPSRVYLVIGEDFQGCFISTDAGQSFSLQSDSPNILDSSTAGDGGYNQSWYSMYVHIDPYNPDIIHVGAINTWRSDDAGVTWTITSHWWGEGATLVHADHHVVKYNYLNNRMYEGNDGGIFWTDDQGETWNNISIGLGIGQLYTLAVSDTNPNKALGGFQDCGTASLTTDGWFSTGGGDGMGCAIDPLDDSYTYISAQRGNYIARFINNANPVRIGGFNTNGITERAAWITPLTLSESDPNTMIIGFKNIWISRNIKDDPTKVKWKKISDNLGGTDSVKCALVETSPVDSNLLFVARYDTTFFRTENLLGNPEWVNLTGKEGRDYGLIHPFSINSMGLVCHPYQRNIVYLVQGSKVFRSNDLGDTWKDISLNLPDIRINKLVYDRSSNEGLYVATDAGVYFKDAQSEGWRLFGLNLPVNVKITDIAITYGPDNRTDSRLRVATYGRGMWECELADADDPLLPPYRLEAIRYERDVKLTWHAPMYPEQVEGYTIYRDDLIVGNSSEVEFLDPDVPDERTVTYRVAANYAEGQKSTLSNEASISPPKNLPYSLDFENEEDRLTTLFTYNNWTLGTSNENNIPGNDGVFYSISSREAGSNMHIFDYVHTPAINLSEFDRQTVTLKFKYVFRSFKGDEKYSVIYRTSPAEEWKTIQELDPTNSTEYTWEEATIVLPDEALVYGVQIGFYYDDMEKRGWAAAFDDVELFANNTGIELVKKQNDFIVYPNPSDDHFTLEISLAEVKPIDISIYNSIGELVYKKKINPVGLKIQQTIDPSLASGNYQIVIHSGNQKMNQSLIIN